MRFFGFRFYDFFSKSEFSNKIESYFKKLHKKIFSKFAHDIPSTQHSMDYDVNPQMQLISHHQIDITQYLSHGKFKSLKGSPSPLTKKEDFNFQLPLAAIIT
jgi:hypothetical protein